LYQFENFIRRDARFHQNGGRGKRCKAADVACHWLQPVEIALLVSGHDMYNAAPSTVARIRISAIHGFRLDVHLIVISITAAV